MLSDFLTLRTPNDLVHTYVLETSIVAAQSQGQTVALIHEDECRLQASTMRGVQLDRVLRSNAPDTKHARLMLERLTTSGTCGLILVSGFARLYADTFFAGRMRALSEKHSTSIVHLP